MKNRKPLLLIFSPVLMLSCAIPLMLWCFSIINSASVGRMTGYTYAGAGCFAAVMVYVFSMVTAIAGLSFAKTHYRWRWCRTLVIIQLAAAVILVIPMGTYAALKLPPLLILMVLYLIWARRYKEDDFESR